MLPIIQPAEPDRVIIGLTEAEISDPYPVIEDLCEEYNVGQVLGRLWNLIEIALMDERYNNAQKRTDLLVWYKKMEKAVEATYALMTVYKCHPLPTKSPS